MTLARDLFVDQGSTFSVDITLTDENGDPFNLSNYDARSSFRRSYYSTNSTNFVVQVFPANSTLTLTLNANVSANVNAGRYVYDVEIFDANTEDVFRVVEGILTITPEATKI